jgi:3-deoxy-D-manno-octulosonate 8-phosphate phosphatase (KDO 8-P phosphatase)
MSKVKLLVCDVDGVLTDGKIYFSKNGEQQKAFNTKDGYGISRIKRRGVIVHFLTASTGSINALRAISLDVACTNVGVDGDKYNALNVLRKSLGLEWAQVAYIGDDLLDMECLRAVGHPFCPADAVQSILNLEKTAVCQRNGGDGCVREVIEILINKDLC